MHTSVQAQGNDHALQEEISDLTVGTAASAEQNQVPATRVWQGTELEGRQGRQTLGAHSSLNSKAASAEAWNCTKSQGHNYSAGFIHSLLHLSHEVCDICWPHAVPVPGRIPGVHCFPCSDFPGEEHSREGGTCVALPSHALLEGWGIWDELNKTPALQSRCRCKVFTFNRRKSVHIKLFLRTWKVWPHWPHWAVQDCLAERKCK